MRESLENLYTGALATELNRSNRSYNGGLRASASHNVGPNGLSVRAMSGNLSLRQDSLRLEKNLKLRQKTKELEEQLKIAVL